VLVGLGALVWLNREALGTVLARVDLRPVLLLPPLLFLVQVIVTALRTVILLGKGAGRDLRGCVACHIVAQVSNQFVPSGAGDFVLKGACLARRLKRPYRRIAGVVLVDRVFDALLAAAVAPATLLVLSGPLSPVEGLGLAAAIVIVLPAVLHGVLHPALSGVQSLAAGREGRIATLASGLTTLYRERRGALGAAYAVTLLRFIVMAGGLALLHRLMFGGDLWMTVILIAPVSQLALLLPVAPGGLGVVEGAWYGALTMAGAESGAAFAFALAVRVYIVIGTLTAGTLAVATHGAALWRNSRRDAAARLEYDEGE
jgi:uncharacterized membrane protein YbhN (UPF0104 family)